MSLLTLGRVLVGTCHAPGPMPPASCCPHHSAHAMPPASCRGRVHMPPPPLTHPSHTPTSPHTPSLPLTHPLHPLAHPNPNPNPMVQARAFLATLGRELLRLPARHHAPLVLDPDFNLTPYPTLPHPTPPYPTLPYHGSTHHGSAHHGSAHEGARWRLQHRQGVTAWHGRPVRVARGS